MRVAPERCAVDLPTLADVMDRGYTPREIRFWIVGAHYRRPLMFSESRMLQARNALKRIDACVLALVRLDHGAPFPEIDQIVYDIRQGFINAMDDDLNFPAALAALFRCIRKINTLIRREGLSPDDAAKILGALNSVDEVMRIFDFPADEMAPDIQSLIAEREDARKAGDFERADRIRDLLRKQGVAIHDTRITAQ